MSDDDARAERAPLRAVRDLGLLLFVAAALVAGLIHYSLARGDVTSAQAPGSAPGTAAAASSPATGRPASTASTTATPTPTVTPTTTATVAPTSAATSPASDPTTATTAPSVSCWDGSVAPRLSSCREPTGRSGLRWVFPTIDRLQLSCHPASRPAGDYQTVVGRECFTRLDGRPLTMVFEQVVSQARAEVAIDRSYAGGRMFAIPGARGGRCTWFDTRDEPARATGYYEGYPYVVSLYAADRATVRAAWSRLVRFRDPADIRGTRG